MVIHIPDKILTRIPEPRTAWADPRGRVRDPSVGGAVQALLTWALTQAETAAKERGEPLEIVIDRLIRSGGRVL